MIINGKYVKASELAKMAGVSRKTICKYYAQDREEYEQEAKARRFKAYTMRSNGFSLKEIAEELDCSYNAAAALVKRYKQQDLKESV